MPSKTLQSKGSGKNNLESALKMPAFTNSAKAISGYLSDTYSARGNIRKTNALRGFSNISIKIGEEIPKSKEKKAKYGINALSFIKPALT